MKILIGKRFGRLTYVLVLMCPLPSGINVTHRDEEMALLLARAIVAKLGGKSLLLALNIVRQPSSIFIFKKIETYFIAHSETSTAKLRRNFLGK